MQGSQAEVIPGKYKLDIKRMIRDYGLVIALVIICAGLTFMSDSFLSVNNLLNVLRQISINGLLAIGVTFVILAGGIDLSVGSILAFSGVVSASLAAGGQPPYVAVIAGIVVGALLGAMNGFVISKAKVSPFIVTLGMMSVARGLTLVYSDGRPIPGLSAGFKFIGGGKILGIPVPVIILLAMLAIFYVILYKTNVGRHIYAVGGNENASRLSGLNINRIKIIVYSISGLMAGLAGVVLTSRVTSGLPQAGLSYELDAIAAVVIGGTSLAGGRGSLFGTFLGVLLIGVINNGLDLMNVSSYYQLIVKGSLIVLAVMLDKKNAE